MTNKLKKVNLGITENNPVKVIVDEAFKYVEELPAFKDLDNYALKARVWQNLLLGVTSTKAGDARRYTLRVPEIGRAFNVIGKEAAANYSNMKLNPFMKERL